MESMSDEGISGPPSPRAESGPKPEGLDRKQISILVHEAGAEVLRERGLLTQGKGVRIPGFIEEQTIAKVVWNIGHTNLVHKERRNESNKKTKEYLGESIDLIITQSIDYLCKEKRSRIYSYPPEQIEEIKAAWKERALALKKERIA